MQILRISSVSIQTASAKPQKPSKRPTCSNHQNSILLLYSDGRNSPLWQPGCCQANLQPVAARRCQTSAMLAMGSKSMRRLPKSVQRSKLQALDNRCHASCNCICIHLHYGHIIRLLQDCSSAGPVEQLLSTCNN